MFLLDDLNNAKRASWAQDILTLYAAAHRTEDDQQSLSDLLTNFMHLAAGRKDIDLVAALVYAKCTFREEYIEERAQIP